MRDSECGYVMYDMGGRGTGEEWGGGEREEEEWGGGEREEEDWGHGEEGIT